MTIRELMGSDNVNQVTIAKVDLETVDDIIWSSYLDTELPFNMVYEDLLEITEYEAEIINMETYNSSFRDETYEDDEDCFPMLWIRISDYIMIKTVAERIMNDFKGEKDKLLAELAYNYSKHAKNNWCKKREYYRAKELILDSCEVSEYHISRRDKDELDLLKYYELGGHTFHIPIDTFCDFEDLFEYCYTNKIEPKLIHLDSEIVDEADLLDIEVCEYIYHHIEII